MMMNKQVRLNLEDEVREFVGDFNKFFDDLKKWSKDSVQIQTWKDHFLKKYPKMFRILLELKWMLMLTPQ